MCTCVLCVIDSVVLSGLCLLLFCCVSVCVCYNVCASFANYCVVVYVFSVLFVCVCACVFLLSMFVPFV